MAESSTKPYMIRALYEWCCDNGYTPYLAVAVDAHTIVPRQHVKGGEIVLNVSPVATSRLTLGNEVVEFQARFSGVAQQISIPIGNISAIYARETGHGMAFDVSRAPAVTDEETDPQAPDGAPGHASLSEDQSGGHSPASSVQSLRGGPRRRGPRSVGRNDMGDAGPASGRPKVTGKDDGDGDAGADAGEADVGDQAANSRKRSSRERGSADVIAFAPAGGSRKKSGAAASRSGADDAAEGPRSVDAKPDGDNEEPPPSDGGGQNGKGGKARLTRVK